MKLFVFTLAAFCIGQVVNAQLNAGRAPLDPLKKVYNVEASCGECQFHMEGKGCHLAIRMNGKQYFVDGTSLDDHGDAHASDGFCEAVKKAQVQGEIVGDRFKATYFRVLKPEEKKENGKVKG